MKDNSQKYLYLYVEFMNYKIAMNKTKHIALDLEVDYIDSRTITQKELVDISTYIQTKKSKAVMTAKRKI